MTPVQWILLAFIAVVLFWMVRRRFGDVSPAEAKRLVESGASLIDVRSPAEFAGGHLPSAKNIPVSELGARIEAVGPKDRPVVVYCASGVRSALARGVLERAGFAQVKNLGAMSRW